MDQVPFQPRHYPSAVAGPGLGEAIDADDAALGGTSTVYPSRWLQNR